MDEMETWVAGELAAIGVDDAPVYAQAFMSLLVGSPHVDAAYARESLREAVSFVDEVAEAHVDDAFAQRVWEQWTMHSSSVVLCEEVRAGACMAQRDATNAAAPAESKTSAIADVHNCAGGEPTTSAQEDDEERQRAALKATVLGLARCSCSADDGALQVVDNHSAVLTKARAETKRVHEQRIAARNLQRQDKQEREAEELRRSNHRLNRSKAVLQSEQKRREEARERDLACRRAAAKRREACM